MAVEQDASSVITTTWPNICPDLQSLSPSLHPTEIVCPQPGSSHPCVSAGMPLGRKLKLPSWLGMDLEVACPFPSCPVVLLSPPFFLRPRAKRGHPIPFGSPGSQLVQASSSLLLTYPFNFQEGTKHQKANFRKQMVGKGSFGIVLSLLLLITAFAHAAGVREEGGW